MGQSKFLKLTVIGALVGATISMLDRSTREHTITTAKKVKDNVLYYTANREELEALVEEKVSSVKSYYNNANKLINKKDELMQIPDTIQGLIGETKAAFTTKKEEL